MRYIAGICLFIASIAFGYWVEPMWELGSTAWFVIWTIFGTLGLICLFWTLLKETISLPRWLFLLISVVVIIFSIVMYTRNNVVENRAAQEEEELSENDKLVLEELRELHRVFEPADNGIHSMMLNAWSKPVKDDIEQEVRGLLNSYVVGPACAPGGGQLKIDLGLNPDSSASNQSSEHLQRLFGECFEKYQSLVKYTLWYWQAYREGPFSTDTDYRSWRDEDKRFIDRLREIIPREEFTTLRETSENLIRSGEHERLQ